jgi:hypothetical protein
MSYTIEDNVDLLDNKDSVLDTYIAMGNICKYLKNGKEVLLFRRHARLSSLYIWYGYGGDNITFKYIYQDNLKELHNQPVEYRKCDLLYPTHLEYLNLSNIIPVDNYEHALNILSDAIASREMLKELKK